MMASERVRVEEVRGVRKVVGGVEVEITRHGKGFRVYRVAKDGSLRTLPDADQRIIMAKFGTPFCVD